ncbi:MAG TPA: endonuclease, partial [Thermodesulfobacteriota bacterium]|nr:endonuclease [Thermodesulfobacteriota bacterium]
MKKVLKAVLIVLCLVFIIATALPLIREDAWWIRIFDFPRAQIAVGGLITATAFLSLNGKKNLLENALSGLLLVCVVYQAYRIYPYTPLASFQSLKSEDTNPDSRFSLLVSNILMYNRN